MQQLSPFLYLATQRRSGSKMIARLLTHWPTSYIFLEPGMALRRFRGKQEAAMLLAQKGIDLPDVSGKIAALPPRKRTAAALRWVLQPLREQGVLVGIKEIHHDCWEEVVSAMGADAKIVVVVRDPRGILDSLRRKQELRKRPPSLPGGLSPRSLAKHLHVVYAAQKRMLETGKAVGIRYEDLCANPTCMADLRRWCGLPADGPGELWRCRETDRELHGDNISSKSAHRWRSDMTHEKEYDQTFALLEEECEYWGYERFGERAAIPPGPPRNVIVGGGESHR